MELKPLIHFEDTHLLVVGKPAGLLSQGETSQAPNLVDYLRSYLGRNYVGLVHRLDRNTSGLMVVAKRTKAAQRLTQSLQKGEISRFYLGILVGKLEGNHRWQHWTKKLPSQNKVLPAQEGTKGAKEAILNVKSVQNGKWDQEWVSLCEFELETGRSHQIRFQSAQMGYPLLGDQKYNSGPLARRFPRPALHSASISFPHPMSKEVLTFKEKCPKDMDRVISKLS